MHRDEHPALRGTWLGRLLRLWNPFMVRLLASPVHWPWSRWFLLLSWAGHRTGRVHTTPVSYVTDGQRIYATTGDSWWHNAVRSPAIEVRLRGRRLSARLVAVTDADESAREHARLFAEHPFFRRLAGIPARSGVPDDAAVRRSIAAGRTLLRLDLELDAGAAEQA